MYGFTKNENVGGKAVGYSAVVTAERAATRRALTGQVRQSRTGRALPARVSSAIRRRELDRQRRSR